MRKELRGKEFGLREDIESSEAGDAREKSGIQGEAKGMVFIKGKDAGGIIKRNEAKMGAVDTVGSAAKETTDEKGRRREALVKKPKTDLGRGTKRTVIKGNADRIRVTVFPNTTLNTKRVLGRGFERRGRGAAGTRRRVRGRCGGEFAVSFARHGGRGSKKRTSHEKVKEGKGNKTQKQTKEKILSDVRHVVSFTEPLLVILKKDISLREK